MKKFFTLIAAAMMAVAANAADYSWSSAGEDAVTEKGGKIEYLEGDGNRLNYANTANDVTYYTICLNGKKGNMGDGSGANSGYMQLTLDEAVKAGDKIIITAYYNKGEDKDVSAYILFDNGTSFSTTPGDFPDILNARQAAEPKTMTYEVPAEAVGSKVIKFSRDKASTNLFITKLVVNNGSTAVEAVKEAKVAPVKVMTANGVVIGNVNAAGQIVK